MSHYFDTSALCRYYHPEAGSDKVIAWIDDAANRSVVSWLTVLELQSAFALKVRTGEISADDFSRLRKRLMADLHGRRLSVVRVLRRHFQAAEMLIAQFGLTQGLRSADALHLAIALDLAQQGVIGFLATADRLLLDIAMKKGLAVADPNST